MRLIDLFEARNWKEIDDQADRWLGQYTYENSPKHVSDDIIKTLQHRYPYKGGTLFRGMNFHTKEEYDNFLSTVSEDGTLTFSGVSSWGDSENEVMNFAQTRPSYGLNAMTMKMYNNAELKGESISGYCGIIISTTIPAGVGIDVNVSRLGHESEVILPPGTYTIKINRLKKYSEILDDSPNIDQIILKSTKEDYQGKSLPNYVLKNHGKELSSKAQEHLFKLFYPLNETFSYEFSKNPTSGLGRLDLIFPSRIFEMYENGIFTSETLISKIKKLANNILNQAIPVIKNFLGDSEYINARGIMYLSKIARRNDLPKIFREQYDKLNVEGRNINNIKDSEERKKMLALHVKKINNLMQMFSY